MAMQTGANDGKIYVWRSPDEEYHQDCVAPTFVSGFKRVKIWGAIRYGKLSKLVIFEEKDGSRLAHAAVQTRHGAARCGPLQRSSVFWSLQTVQCSAVQSHC